MKTKYINNQPFALAQYAKTLLPKKAGKHPKLPKLKIVRENIAIDKEQVAAYAKVCGFQKDKNFIPAIYPHILAFPLHIELMLDKKFPFQIIGMVHINNSITQYKPIAYNEILSLEVYFDALKQHDKGLIVPIITKCFNAYGELVWESRSENLKITKKSSSKGKKSKEAVMQGDQEQWKLDTYAGLRYAKVAGDVNPIHLFPITAKAFGFKRHIIHGMWNKARVVAALQNEIGHKPFTVKVDFKLPVFLPSTITFTHSTNANGIGFEVRDKKNEKPHLKGSIDYI